ncbi:hypothetical protein GCM10007108_04130 [Thermogymnomonas acidicola]|uniref:Uncharacterized protein n=1 Tax=Thermogymnomonas acidicola TaxID=399579 RepID=A0AA37BR21_9ARCH|nr:hypothetical protein [Thermogymnomonas acidicola]GGM69177.1 hypothetical protein GCM10007108_04130 [Thermogymnomonas acidicola]
MSPGPSERKIPKGFFRSCKRYQIPERVAREIAEAFMAERDRYPRTYGEVLEVVE